MIIAVRGGHNERVRGAKGYIDEVIEDRLYYRELVSFLEREGHKVMDVTPNSTDTKYQDLTYGVDKANKAKADLFISCHVNSSNGKGYGCEVLYCPGSIKGAEYATNISKAISELGFRNRGAKVDSRGLYELRHTKMPAVIIEPFFLDNKGDFDIYKRVGPKELAKAITEGVLNKSIDEVKGDDDMIPTIKLAACKYNPIAENMIKHIKGLQSCVKMEQTGVATQELCMKLPQFNGGESKGSATILQDILIEKGYLSNSKDRPTLGPAVKSAVERLRKEHGIPTSTKITDTITWRKLIEY